MNIDKQIEFDKIKNIWADLAITDYAKELIQESKLYFSESELKKQLRDTTDARNMLEKVGTPPLQNVSEIKDVLTVVEKGDCLTPYQLERVEKVLVAIRRLKDYLTRGRAYDNSLAFYDENLNEIQELAEEISEKIRGGIVDDYATKELEQIRKQMTKCEEQMKKKADLVLHSGKNYMTDNYATFRNGRICVPVKKEYKLKVPGTVIDKSTTGNTLFIEPSGVAKYYEKLQLLKIDEENEVYRILYTLSTLVLANASAIYEDLEMIEKLDFIFSKGKLSIDMDGVEPSINTERIIHMVDARHPLMDKNIAVPLQFDIGENARGIVITGPNTGGKTVVIKTVMLNSIMAQSGLHVTCKQADICMNSSYLCDIGDGQNLSENLSTFSAHIVNVLNVLREVDENSFIIMDELGSGTDPTEGMGIAIAILEELKKSRANFLVTTHYPEVKEYAAKTEGILNARMEFDKETLRPTYQMITGQAGESCAFYIADRLGMPQSMLKVAIGAAYGEEAVKTYVFWEYEDGEIRSNDDNQKGNIKPANKIKKAKTGKKTTDLSTKYRIGDSVMVYPDKKIGIVCMPVNEKGVLRVQLSDKKIWINHKRVKLHVAATELYPEDYDFSIVFDSVENRKKRHDMGRKYTDEIIEVDE
ncbi:MAG: DNA mismatch repair protein MutS [Lachnospiraceae bacterium]|nr:DNA mismatch repair protein MutS [Lachnospiraceae bacterium]